MSKLLQKIQKEQLENRKLAAELKSEPQKSRAKLLTYFIGELERVYKLDSISDKEVIAKLKNVADSLPDEAEQTYLRSFMPETYSDSWHRGYVLHSNAKDVPSLMKQVKLDEAGGKFDKIVDKKLLNKFLQERLTN